MVTIRFPQVFSSDILSILFSRVNSESRIECSHSMNLPSIRINSSGNEIIVSPLLESSGIEFYPEQGDTIIAMLDKGYAETNIHTILIRVEPIESLGMIKETLNLI